MEESGLITPHLAGRRPGLTLFLFLYPIPIPILMPFHLFLSPPCSVDGEAWVGEGDRKRERDEDRKRG